MFGGGVEGRVVRGWGVGGRAEEGGLVEAFAGHQVTPVE